MDAADALEGVVRVPEPEAASEQHQGPEAAEHGGRIVVAGPPPAIMAEAESHTGRFLRQHLNAGIELESDPSSVGAGSE